MLSQNKLFNTPTHRCSRYTSGTKDSVSGGVSKADAMESRVMASVSWLAESTEEKLTLTQVMQKSKLVEKLKIQIFRSVHCRSWYGFPVEISDPNNGGSYREKAECSAFRWGDYTEKLFSLSLRTKDIQMQTILRVWMMPIVWNIPSKRESMNYVNPWRHLEMGPKNVYIKTSARFPARKDFQVLFTTREKQ